MDTLLVIPLLLGPVQIDGVLQEPQYAQALSLEVAHVVEPSEVDPLPTEVYLWHDSTHLYVGARLSEPYGIRAENVRRDQANWGMDNFLMLMIGLPPGDQGYLFVVNPLGTVGDARLYNYTDFQFGWDLDWRAQVQRVGDTLWTGEMALPLADLGFQDTLYLQILRSATLPDDAGFFEIISWAPADLSHTDLTTAQPLLLEGGLYPRKTQGLPFRVSLLPTLTLVWTSPFFRDPGYFWLKGSGYQYRIGADLSLKGEGWSLSATFLPDFAQVEADVAELNLSRRQALRLPEKRPFFYEGLELFGTWMNPLYTRAFVDVRSAVKGEIAFSGRTRAQVLGVQEAELGRIGGVALGHNTPSWTLRSLMIAHRNRVLGDLYLRYLHPSGAKFRAEGLALSDSGWALSLAVNYQTGGIGPYFALSGVVLSPNLEFPTLLLSYGNDLIKGSLYLGYNGFFQRKWLPMVILGGGVTRRHRFQERSFFNESWQVSGAVSPFSPLVLGFYGNGYRDFSRYAYRFQGVAVQLGLVGTRQIGFASGWGHLGGQRARNWGLYGSYQWKTFRFGGGLEIYLVAAEGGGWDTLGTAHMTVAYRHPSGLYLRLFLQRAVQAPPFPEREVQLTVAYEPGGRSRLYFVFHPFQEIGESTFWRQSFLKVGYEMRL